MDARLDFYRNDIAGQFTKHDQLSRGSHHRLDLAGSDPGAGQDPSQPDQRLRRLPRHAHQGCRARRRKLAANQPCRGLARGDRLH